MNFGTKQLILAFAVLASIDEGCTITSSDQVLYNMRARIALTCSKSSPETFFNKIAEPSLTLLYHRSKALFGILMDKIEASTSSEDENRNQEWEYITDTVTTSLDSAINRLETEWRYFIELSDAKPLPWEVSSKPAILHETVGRLEYGYLMVDAVVRAGVKEIVGTLQHQLVGVIRSLEKEVSKFSSDDNEDVTEHKLLNQMRRGLAQMKPSFTTKLLEKVVQRALGNYKPPDSSPSSSTRPSRQNFISEPLEQIAIVFHAFREKEAIYANFWNEISAIFHQELDNSNQRDITENVSGFIQELVQDQDKLINLVIQLVARDKNRDREK